MHLIPNPLKRLKFKTKTELAVTVVGSVEPISTIPQVIRIYQLESADQLPLFTWSFYMVASLTWLAYGIQNKSIPIILTSVLWMLVYLPIIVGIILF